MKTAARGERPFEVDGSRADLVARGAGGLPHAFGDDADFLDTGALRRVDDVDDVLVLQRAGADDEHRLVVALVEDVRAAGSASCRIATSSLLTAIRRSAVYSSTIWPVTSVSAAGRSWFRPAG